MSCKKTLFTQNRGCNFDWPSPWRRTQGRGLARGWSSELRLLQDLTAQKFHCMLQLLWQQPKQGFLCLGLWLMSRLYPRETKTDKVHRLYFEKKKKSLMCSNMFKSAKIYSDFSSKELWHLPSDWNDALVKFYSNAMVFMPKQNIKLQRETFELCKIALRLHLC